MFTGLVQAVGEVTRNEVRDAGRRLELDADVLVLDQVAIGDSVAVNGVCLTVVAIRDRRLAFDVSAETASRTLIGEFQPGRRLNLELALTPTTRLGGHLVSGHVDGLARLRSRHSDQGSVRMTFGVVRDLGRFVAEKGSVCLDGVSLTVNGVHDLEETRFDVNIVPHTMTHTTFGDFASDQVLHLEVDIIARYLNRLQGVCRP